MNYGKGAATGYSDYYKNHSQGVDDASKGTQLSTDNNTDTPDNVVKRRKAAMRRRLQMQQGK